MRRISGVMTRDVTAVAPDACPAMKNARARSRPS